MNVITLIAAGGATQPDAGSTNPGCLQVEQMHGGLVLVEEAERLRDVLAKRRGGG